MCIIGKEEEEEKYQYLMTDNDSDII